MDLKVFKFGGASVKDADGIKNVCNIIQHSSQALVVVISAMGKTTNAMEELFNTYVKSDHHQLGLIYKQIKDYHFSIFNELFNNDTSFIEDLESIFNLLRIRLEVTPSDNYDFEYDQIVSFGEILSTTIVSLYANYIGLKNNWVDIRTALKTDDNYRDAGINWGLSGQFVHKSFNLENASLYITQGFIGSTISNHTTTLGREGSDYSGAVLAYLLGAESLTIWKDVPGVLNADPRWYPKAEKIKELSYPEAIELAFYGAQVIHPKTLKPLQNKAIPLYVKSFVDINIKGTVIKSIDIQESNIPIFILKTNQIFITISPRDFSFIMEDNLSEIFSLFGKFKVKINLMQNSALNFSVCANHTREISGLLSALTKKFAVRYNENLELVTVRNYNDNVLQMITKNKDVVDSQLSRKTARFVLRTSEWDF